jgi:hypothetical protein
MLGTVSEVLGVVRVVKALKPLVCKGLAYYLGG